MRALLLSLALLVPAAHAGEAVLHWTAPTETSIGTPLTDLAGFRVYYGTAAGDLNRVLTLNDPGATTVTITPLTPATWYFAMTAFNALESDRTDLVSKVVTDVSSVPPAPPSGARVAGTQVYTVIKRVNRFVLLPVGTVPPGTVCDVTQGVNGYYVVPREAVSWSGLVRPDVVVAPCG